MSEIKLFPHNEEAYQGLVESLGYQNLSLIERATGTGKSYILIKYLASHMSGKRILFVTLHNSMFKQLSERDMPALGTSKNVFSKIDCVLYSSINKKSAEWYYNNYDCFVFDEAHHCGAPKWGETISELRDLVRDSNDKIMIGATATSIRYLDNYMDVAKEYFDGNVASRLYLSDAILREILPAPYYINLNHSSIEKINEVQKKLRNLSGFRELDSIREQVDSYENTIKLETDINHLLRKNGIKNGEKYIVFCSSIKDLVVKKEEAKNWFEGLGTVKTYEVHSNQTDKKNQNEITDYENDSSDNIKLMFAVDMFNEGLHIKGVDGIIMTRKTTSPIIYLQQLGRALSFSSRKKQIKIFDLAGNASKINVIQNLYKEMITNAEYAIQQNSENVNHYKEVINRFHIVEEGVQLNERLDAISEFLSSNYLIKENIKKLILILKNYVSIYHINFMDALSNGEIDADHLRAYKELQKNANYLSMNDYLALNELGIILTDYQKDKYTLEKIGNYGSYQNIVNKEIEDTMNSYNIYYINHRKRPTEDNDLYAKYRKLLIDLKPNVISKYLKKAAYPLSVEELLLLREYPSIESINQYLDIIESKYLNGIALDRLELKTAESIKKLVSSDDRHPIFSLLNNNTIIIDRCIKTIQRYLSNNPNEKCQDIKRITDKNVLSAYKTLEKNAKYVTNQQFDLLLSLSIKLPSDIDMTKEERKKKIGSFNSMHEWEENQFRLFTNRIIDFINQNKKIPNKDDELYKEMENIFQQRRIFYAKKISNAMFENNIPLNAKQKFVIDIQLSKEDLTALYNDIIREIQISGQKRINIEFCKEELKCLKKQGFIDEMLFSIIRRTLSCIHKIYELENDIDQLDYLKKYLSINQGFVPFNLMKRLSDTYGIQLRQNNIDSRTINLVHKKYQQLMRQLDEYIDYVKDNNKRPPENGFMESHLREYLEKASVTDVNRFINRLNSLGISLRKEEIFLAGKLDVQSKKELYQRLLQKRKQAGDLDSFDKKIFLDLRLNEISNSDSIPGIVDLNRDVRADTIEGYKEMIKQNPEIKLDNEKGYIPIKELSELEQYRISVISESFLIDVMNQMKEKKEGYEELLSSEDLKKLIDIINYCKKENQHLDLLDSLMKLNRQIVLNNNQLNIEEFIKNYLNYIEKNQKLPVGNDLEAKVLLEQKSIIEDLLTKEEKIEFKKEVDRKIDNLKKTDFYDRLIDFVTENERFPSVLSSNYNEIELAIQFQSIGGKITGEKKKEIQKLMSKYQMNTIMYANRKKGR